MSPTGPLPLLPLVSVADGSVGCCDEMPVVAQQREQLFLTVQTDWLNLGSLSRGGLLVLLELVEDTQQQ